MRISVKLAPTLPYPELERFWREADRLGFDWTPAEAVRA